MQYNIEELFATNTEIVKQKWKARLARSYYTRKRVNSSEQLQERKRKFLPKELRPILNLTTAKCTKCKGTKICFKQHLDH